MNYLKRVLREIFLKVILSFYLSTNGTVNRSLFFCFCLFVFFFNQVLNAKFLRVKERHLFLEYLGRAHYDPTHPNYISLERLVALPDESFCSEVASASLDDFERFQKTM